MTVVLLYHLVGSSGRMSPVEASLCRYGLHTDAEIRKKMRLGNPIEEFERHFIPQEYDSEYSTITEVFTLKEDTDYQLILDAKCESGTMQISILYEGADEKSYSVNPNTPCNEILTVPTDSVNEVIITVYIEPDTYGSVIGSILANK